MVHDWLVNWPLPCVSGNILAVSLFSSTDCSVELQISLRSIMYSTPCGLPALVAAGRRQHLLHLLPPRGNIVWFVETCQRKQTLEYMLDHYQCDGEVKPLD